MRKTMLSNIEERFKNIEVCLILSIAGLLDAKYKNRPFQLFNAKFVEVNKLEKKIRMGDDEKKKEPTTSSNDASATSLDKM